MRRLCALTVQEAVVFEAASAEQRVEGVQALFALHGASVRPIDVGRALRRQSAGQLLLRQLFVPETQTGSRREVHSTASETFVINRKRQKNQEDLGPQHQIKYRGHKSFFELNFRLFKTISWSKLQLLNLLFLL